MADTFTPPQVGDTVNVSINGHYHQLEVFDVREPTSEDKSGMWVYASAKGLGSFKFKWHTVHGRGYDNRGGKYYLVNRAEQ